MDNVRVWVAPNGVVLCADQQFSGLMGYPSECESVALEHSSVSVNQHLHTKNSSKHCFYWLLVSNPLQPFCLCLSALPPCFPTPALFASRSSPVCQSLYLPCLLSDVLCLLDPYLSTQTPPSPYSPPLFQLR
jgi:hypothetical protein